MEQCDFWLLSDGVAKCDLIDGVCTCGGNHAHCALGGTRIPDVLRKEEEITLREAAAQSRKRRNLREAS